MRITITGTAAMIVVLTFCAFAPARADQRHSTYVQGALPDFAYTVHGKLWLRSLHGSSAWPVSTPWPVSGIDWSPDGRAIAFQGRSGIGVAVLHGHTGRTVFARRLSGCCSAELGWSPNSRYLAFDVSGKIDLAKMGSVADLWLWDRTTRRGRLLQRGVSLSFPIGSWAHDSRHIAVAAGAQMPSFDSKGNPTAEVLDIRSGHVTRLGKGVPGEWSPDGRFIGFDHLWICGATGCFVQEDIMPSSGGRPTVLDRYVRGGWLTDEEWAPRRYGYAYDRWLLGPRGHVLRRLVPRVLGRLNRVESWSPDGHWVAAKWVTPSYRIVLTLTNADTGRSRTVYVSAPTGTCDACMNQGYELTWNHTGTAFALLTPDMGGPPPKEVKPSLYIFTLSSGTTPSRLSKGLPMRHPNPTVLGWVDHDRAVIVYSGRTLFRYAPGRPRLVPVVRGLPYSLNYFGSGYGNPVALRPGA